MTDPSAPRDTRSLLHLIRDLPSILIALAKAELNHAKSELLTKLKAAGIGAAFFVVAAVFGWLALNVFIAAAILLIGTALPPWIAAVIVGGGFLILAVILVLIGIKALKRGVPPVPTATIGSVKDDVNAIKGVGRYE